MIIANNTEKAREKNHNLSDVKNSVILTELILLFDTTELLIACAHIYATVMSAFSAVSADGSKQN